jgi:hypothetical protein
MNLEALAHELGGAKKTATGWIAFCPIHEADGAQHTPSLAIDEKNGKILVHCRAGCDRRGVIAALKERRLWPSSNGANGYGNGRATDGFRSSPSVIPPGAAGKSEPKIEKRNRRVQQYDVCDLEGRHIAGHVRNDFEYLDFDTDKWLVGKDLFWQLPSGKAGLGGIRVIDLPLFGTERLRDLDPAQTQVLVTEGEKKCVEGLWQRGVTAALATVTGAGPIPSDVVLSVLLRFAIVVLWPDNDPPGRAHMRAIANALRRLGHKDVRIIDWPDAPPKGDAADFKGSDEELRALIAAARPAPADDCAQDNDVVVVESPRPLKREVDAAQPYPYKSLGSVLAPAVEAIREATQAPLGICAQAILATANLCVQPHINIELPSGEVKPVSEYFVSVAESGERKTAADERALCGVHEHVRILAEKFRDEQKFYENDLEAFERRRAHILNTNAKKDQAEIRLALELLGYKPESPRKPMLIGDDPTYEGLVRLLREGHGYGGLFSSEGGMFIGGHGMTKESKLRTATGLSNLWDGKEITRIRGGEGIYALYNRRFALHLLVQPTIADLLFGDDLLINQGLLSRVLAVAPDGTAGSRPFRRLKDAQNSSLGSFKASVLTILNTEIPHADRDLRELRPRTVALNNEAERLWIEFHDHIDTMLVPEGALAPIKSLASKAPEHAARLAATIEGFADLHVERISASAMMGGIELVQHYLFEALRIYGAIQDSPDLTLATKALDWIRNRPNGIFTPRELYQLGPYAIRDSEKAKKIIDILADHGWIAQIPRGAIVDGAKRREVYALTAEAQKLFAGARN